jgi:hypothetical protein
MYTEIDDSAAPWSFRRAEGEADEGQRGCLLLIVGAVVVGASAWMASREIVYLWRGQIVDATVVRTLDLQTERPHTIIDFDYADPQTKESRRSSTEMPLGWRAPGGRLKIECVPGSDTFARVRITSTLVTVGLRCVVDRHVRLRWLADPGSEHTDPSQSATMRRDLGRGG